MKKVLDWFFGIVGIALAIFMIATIPRALTNYDELDQQDTIMVKTEINNRLDEELKDNWYNPFYTVSDGTGWFTVDGIDVKYTYYIKNGAYEYMYVRQYTFGGFLDRFIDAYRRVIEEF